MRFSSASVFLLVNRITWKPRGRIITKPFGGLRSTVLVKIQVRRCLIGFLENNNGLDDKGTDIYECVQFGADPNKELDAENPNVGDWRLLGLGWMYMLYNK